MSEIGNYKPNSHKSKEEAVEKEKRVEKVVTSDVTVKKKSEVSKLTDVFISEDAANVKSYILMDVLIPAAKKMVFDIITNGIDMILYGGNGGNRGERRNNASYVSYNRFSDRAKENSRYESTRTRSGFSYNDIIFNNRGEAEEVLSLMYDILDTYPYVTVADLFDLVGQSCEFTYQKYGWTNLRNAEVVRVRDGYMIKLPKALPID